MDPSEISETQVKSDNFTNITAAGKKAAVQIANAFKTDNVPEIIQTIQNWLPETLSLLVEVILAKAKGWEKIDRDEQLAFLRDIDFAPLLTPPTAEQKSPIKMAKNTGNELFQAIHTALVSLEAGQLTTLEKLNTALAVGNDVIDSKDFEKVQKKALYSFNFLHKHGDKVSFIS